MDLTRDVTYRSFTLNDEDIADSTTPGNTIESGITGCVMDSADFSDVDVTQFMEKRSQQDGMDAGDVFLGTRRLRIAGTLYAVTRALLFDSLWSLRAALSPVLAQREEPLDRGYRPLYFSVPTDRIADYPSGVIYLRLLAMPRAFSAMMNRDQIGGEDNDSLAIPWQATLICKDPSIMAADPQDYDLTAQTNVTGTTCAAATNLFTKASHGLTAGDRITFSAKTGGTGITLGTAYYVIASGLTSSAFKVSTTSGGTELDVTTDLTVSTWTKSVTTSGNLSNRGTYICPVNMLVTVGAGAGSIVATIGDSVFTISIPASTGSRIVRFNGEDKFLTVEEDSVEAPRMDLVTFNNDTTWPLVSTGVSAYSVTVHGALTGSGSHFWFYERYA